MAIFNGTVVRLVPSFLKVSSLFPFEESDSWKQVEEKNGVEGVWTASYYDGEIYEKNFNFHVRKLAGTITPDNLSLGALAKMGSRAHLTRN